MVDEEIKKLKNYRKAGKVIEIIGGAMIIFAFFLLYGVAGTIEYETGKTVQTITLKMYIFYAALSIILGVVGVAFVNFGYKLRKYVHNQIRKHLN